MISEPVKTTCKIRHLEIEVEGSDEMVRQTMAAALEKVAELFLGVRYVNVRPPEVIVPTTGQVEPVPEKQ